jgi:SpoVK/Ycf46/Vps4 family AAA+-type ATPase
VVVVFLIFPDFIYYFSETHYSLNELLNFFNRNKKSMAEAKIKEFRILYEKAQSESFVKQVPRISSRVDAIIKMGAAPIEEVNLAIKSIGEDIAALIQPSILSARKEGKQINLNPPLKNLLKFIGSIKVQEESFLECKDPLSGEKIKTSFNDIAGLEDVKQAMETGYILPFKYPGLFPTVVRGILLYGPGGTGKSLMAKAASKELGKSIAFYAPTPGELKGKYEGETEKNIAAVFDCASRAIESEFSQYTAAIIFLDEVDSIGGKRGDDASMTRSVNALLQAMDGIKSNAKVSVLAATNLPSSLDSALLSRFTTTIFIDLPDPIAIEYIIRSELAKLYCDPTMTEYEKLATVRDSNGNFVLDANYMKNIASYGGHKGLEIIDDAYVMELVGMFGPTAEGKKIKEQVLAIKRGGKGKIDESKLDSSEHIFGYAPRSIVKVVEQATRLAAAKAVPKRGQDFFTRTVTFGPENKPYEVTCPLGIKTLCRRLNLNDANDEKVRSRIINFTIQKSDFIEALKTIPSTVDNHEYVELLKY